MKLSVPVRTGTGGLCGFLCCSLCGCLFSSLWFSVCSRVFRAFAFFCVFVCVPAVFRVFPLVCGFSACFPCFLRFFVGFRVFSVFFLCFSGFFRVGGGGFSGFFVVRVFPGFSVFCVSPCVLGVFFVVLCVFSVFFCIFSLLTDVVSWSR